MCYVRQSVVGLAVLVCLLLAVPVQADTEQARQPLLEALIGTWNLLIKTEKIQNARYTFNHLYASGMG